MCTLTQDTVACVKKLELCFQLILILNASSRVKKPAAHADRYMDWSSCWSQLKKEQEYRQQVPYKLYFSL